MPEQPGGGGGSSMDLVLKFAGLTAVAEKYEEFVQAVEEVKQGISDAEIQAAQVLATHASETATNVKEALGTAESAKKIQEQAGVLTMRLMRDYQKMGTGLVGMRESLARLSGAPEPQKPQVLPEISKKQQQDKLRAATLKFANVGQQASTAMGAAMRRISSAMPFGIGGFIGLLLWGQAYPEKIRTQVEHYTQLFESAVDASSDKSFATSQVYAAKIGKQLTHLTETFRLSKEEAGALVGVFTQGGITAKELWQKTNIHLGKSRASVIMANAAIDQTLRLQAGTAAQTSTKIMTKFGVDAATATDHLGILAISAKESGIGVMNFMNQTLEAASAMRQYGGDLDDARMMAKTLQSELEKGGLQHHMAGNVAIMATGQAAAGMAQLSKGMQMAIAEQLGYGSGMAGYFKMRDRWLDKTRGSGEAIRGLGVFMDMISKGRNLEAHELAYATEKLLSVQPVVAKALTENLAVIRSATASSAEKAQAQTAFANALEKERSRTADWKVSFKDLMIGLGKIGHSLFELMIGGLTELVVLFREVPLAFMEFIGSLAIPLEKLPFGLGETVKSLVAEVPPGFGAVSLAARALAHGGLSPEEQKLREKLQGIRAKVRERNERVIQTTLRQGLMETGKAAGDILTPSSAGMRALLGALGTPGAMRELAMMTDPEQIERLVQQANPILAEGLGGAGIRKQVELGAGQMTTLGGAARRGDIGGVTESLAGAVAKADPTSQWDIRNLVITSVDLSTPGDDGVSIANITFARRPDAAARIEAAEEAAQTRGAASAGADDGDAGGATYQGPGQVVQFDPMLGQGRLGVGSYTHQFRGGHVHAAQDIAAPGGTPVFAPVTGTVRTMRRPGGQATAIITDENTGLRHYLAHMKDMSKGLGRPLVVEDGPVVAGQQVGELAPSALSPPSEKGAIEDRSKWHKTGAHLHYRIVDPKIRKDPENRLVGTINPFPHIKALRE